jgi:sialate O-acetylesterase
MKKTLLFLLIIVFFGQSITAQNKLRLPSLVSDNMVIQQSTQINIWGWAEKKKNVEITPSWNNALQLTQSDKEGKWKTTLNTPSAGGPFTIKISSNKETISIENVMVGEVWLASGQSNMEMPIKGYASEPINGNNELILHSKNPNIRMFTVKRNSNPQPVVDCVGTWKESSPENTPDFSAVAYVFAQKHQSCFGCPCGDYPQQLGRDSGRGLDTKRSN